MKPKPHLSSLLLASASVQLLASSALFAQTSWNVDSSGNWSDTTKWSGTPNPPDASGVTVNFTNNIINTVRTITIDGTSPLNRTVVASGAHVFAGAALADLTEPFSISGTGDGWLASWSRPASPPQKR